MGRGPHASIIMIEQQFDGVGTLAHDLNNDRPFWMSFMIDELACSYSVGDGDLLLFRDDVMHRTQPHRTGTSYRTSLNVNAMPQGRLKATDLLAGGMGKYKFMFMSPGQYLGLFPESQRLLLFAGIFGGYHYRSMLGPI